MFYNYEVVTDIKHTMLNNLKSYRQSRGGIWYYAEIIGFDAGPQWYHNSVSELATVIEVERYDS